MSMKTLCNSLKRASPSCSDQVSFSCLVSSTSNKILSRTLLFFKFVRDLVTVAVELIGWVPIVIPVAFDDLLLFSASATFDRLLLFSETVSHTDALKLVFVGCVRFLTPVAFDRLVLFSETVSHTDALKLVFVGCVRFLTPETFDRLLLFSKNISTTDALKLSFVAFDELLVFAETPPLSVVEFVCVGTDSIDPTSGRLQSHHIDWRIGSP